MTRSFRFFIGSVGLCLLLHSPSLAMENKDEGKESKQKSETFVEKKIDSNDIPIEALVNIFSFLEITDTKDYTLVNQNFYDAICLDPRQGRVEKSTKAKKSIQYFCSNFKTLKHQNTYINMAKAIIIKLPKNKSIYGFSTDEIACARLNAYYLLWEQENKEENKKSEYASEFLKIYEDLTQNDNTAKEKFKGRYDKLKSGLKN